MNMHDIGMVFGDEPADRLIALKRPQHAKRLCDFAYCVRAIELIIGNAISNNLISMFFQQLCLGFKNLVISACRTGSMIVVDGENLHSATSPFTACGPSRNRRAYSFAMCCQL